MSVFINYGAGPKLDKKQKQVVRSQAMVSVRGQQKEKLKQRQVTRSKDVTNLSLNPRRLAPAAARKTRGSDRSSEDSDELDASSNGALALVNSGRKRIPGNAVQRSRLPAAGKFRLDNPYDMRGAPPQSTHMTGVEARVFQDYLTRCGAYTSYLDEAFVLVGFRQQSYFRPDMSKAACIYIGWLLTAGVLDAFRGNFSEEISYPYYEWQAIKELQRFIDGANARELHEVVYPVIILGMFEMVRFSPRTITHLAAVERFIKTRGGLNKMPIVMQHIVIMGDMLQCVCLDTPLAFNHLGPSPIMRHMTAEGFLAGDQLCSSPLLLCGEEDFSLAARFVVPSIALQVVGVLQLASDAFRSFFDLDGSVRSSSPYEVEVDLDAIIDNPAAHNDVPALFLEACALAARITRRTLSECLDGFDDIANEQDVLAIYDNTRFVGLKAWTGLPYVYVWVNLIGFAASTNPRMRSYFIAEVVRCAFSYGCYQIEVYQGVLRNFLHLRNAIAGRKMAMAVLSSPSEEDNEDYLFE
ncbi:hypothetical protein QBC35DRAFT_135486 [Podospora australis]|uniref:Uncharacterized protein n=1 Tax=Podospora australis TaxID=1536484 RepID=A0AAN7AD99_9PEZI|nr:hypothetical protein QBC35DRAFT_135486 [Podospora australis]